MSLCGRRAKGINRSIKEEIVVFMIFKISGLFLDELELFLYMTNV